MLAISYRAGMTLGASSSAQPSSDQLRVIEAVYERFAADGEWPLIDDLQHAYDRADGTLDIEAVADSLDRRFGWRNRGQNDTFELTLCGVALCGGAADDLADVLAVGQYALGRYLKEGPGFVIESSEVAPALANDEIRVGKVLVLGQWLPGFGGGSRGENSWSRQITREIRRWRDARSIRQMVDLAPCSRVPDASVPGAGLGWTTLDVVGDESTTGAASEDDLAEARPDGRGSYSMREFGAAAPTHDEFVGGAWGGLIAIIQSLVGSNAYALAYPSTCDEYPSQIVGTDLDTLALAIADHAGIGMPLDASTVPATAETMDLVEFTHAHVAQAEAEAAGWHGFFKHHHLDFDVQTGQSAFRDQINSLFRRHKLAFGLNSRGEVERIGSPTQLAREKALPASGDSGLDERLARALVLYRNPDVDSRLEATRELWDCFERLKSLANPKDKKKSTAVLLEQLGGSGPLLSVVFDDARELTNIGNQFGIRHAEIGQHEVADPTQVDYLFGRLFNLIWSLLRARDVD